MSYIVIVNPTILSTQGTGMPFSGVLTATVIISSAMSLLMGVYAKLPFAVAPGMGLNAFFAFTIVLNGGVPWPVPRRLEPLTSKAWQAFGPVDVRVGPPSSQRCASCRVCSSRRLRRLFQATRQQQS